MCRKCVAEEQPDRGTACLDTGAYLANFKACAACGVRATLRATERVEDEDADAGGDGGGDEEEETVNFKRASPYELLLNFVPISICFWMRAE